LRGAELENFWGALWRSEQRETLLTPERSYFLDSKQVLDNIVKLGKMRINDNTLQSDDSASTVPFRASPGALQEASPKLGFAAALPVLPAIEVRLGLSDGIVFGQALGVTIHEKLQILVPMRFGFVAGPPVDTKDSTFLLLTLGLEARLVSSEFLGVRGLGGFGVRGKLLNEISSARTEGIEQYQYRRYTGIGYGPIVGGKKRISGNFETEGWAFSFTVQPERTNWSSNPENTQSKKTPSNPSTHSHSLNFDIGFELEF